VTSSFGVASLGIGDPRSADELYSAADDQLYRAKNAGRNRVM
jgi:PleD family two-component response regulator